MTHCNEFNHIKKAFDQHFNSAYKDPKMFMEDDNESEDEKKERMGYPSISPKQLLQECGLGEVGPKLDEHKITAPLFWEMKEDQFESLLDIKLFGEKKTLSDKM